MNRIFNLKRKINKKKAFIVLFITIFISIVAICIINPKGLNKLLASVTDVPNSNFEDKEFYSCVIDSYNAENNTNKLYTDNLTDKELASLKTLTCSNNNITNTVGLSTLTGLKTLDIVDVGEERLIDLSSNKELETLDLNGSSLISLDLTNNVKLKKVDASNTGLLSIDVTKSELLEELYISNCSLYYIDLSNNINLKKLKLSKNYLPHVDLTNNINLEEIYINNIRQLFDVELGQKPKLKIFSIKRTDYEYENDIEYLDLSGVNASADIEIDGSPIKKMKTSNEIDYTGKEYLMYENDLEYLSNLSGVQRRVILRDNKIIEPKYKLAFRDGYTFVDGEAIYYNKMEVNESIDVNSFIKNLGLQNLSAKVFNGDKEVTSGNIEDGQLLKIYDSNGLLIEVKLTVFINDKFNDSVLHECVLREYTKVNKGATDLNNADFSLISNLSCGTVPGTIFDTKGIELLTNLKTLNLQNEAIETIDLSNNPLLTNLYLANNNIKNIDLSNNSKLEYLDLPYNKIENAGDIILNLDFDTNTNTVLNTLNLEGNLLTEFKVDSLQGIKYLLLTNNRINSVDISQNKTLLSISLSLNNLKSSEDIVWGDLTKLRTVDLSLNELDNIDLSTLVNLTALNLFHNDLSFSKSKLKGLDLSKNTKLTTLLLASTNIEELDLSRNNLISDITLIGNKKLKTVNFNNNSVEFYGFVIGNGIEKIDLYNAKEFGGFYLYGNKLESINSCPNSYDIDYEELATKKGMNLCNNNGYMGLYLINSPIKKVDLKAAPNFIFGIFLNCDIKDLDLRYSSGLESLYSAGNDLKLKSNYVLKGSKKTIDENIKFYGRLGLKYRAEDSSIANFEDNVVEGKEVGITKYTGTSPLSSSAVFFREKQKINELDGEIIVYDFYSDKYIINHEEKYIYTSMDVDKEKILSNITVKMLEPVMEDNKVKLVDNGIVIDEYKIINFKINNYKFQEKFIYTRGEAFDISNVIVTNGTAMHSGNRLYIRYNNKTLETFDILARLLGDVNDDGKVNLSDVSKLYRYIKKRLKLTEMDLMVSDVNFDDNVNLSDVSKLYRYIKGNISSLEAE